MTLREVAPFELRLTINYVTIKPWMRICLLRCQVS